MSFRKMMVSSGGCLYVSQLLIIVSNICLLLFTFLCCIFVLCREGNRESFSYPCNILDWGEGRND